MSVEADDLRILRLHKTWADRYTLLWQLFVLVLFGGIYWFLEQFGIEAEDRAGAFVLLAVVVLTATIWQAVGLGVARIHLLLDGIDLEARGRRGKRSDRDQP